MRAEHDHGRAISLEGSVSLADPPKAGYWAVKLAKNAPEVAAAIVWVHTTHDPDYPEILMDRSPFPVGYINGKIVDCDAVITRRRREITKAEYEFLLADRKWAATYAPETPEANPMRPVEKVKPQIPPPAPRVDVRALPPIF